LEVAYDESTDGAFIVAYGLYGDELLVEAQQRTDGFTVECLRLLGSGWYKRSLRVVLLRDCGRKYAHAQADDGDGRLHLALLVKGAVVVRRPVGNKSLSNLAEVSIGMISWWGSGGGVHWT